MINFARGSGDYVAAIAGGLGVALIAALIVLALSRVTLPTLRYLWHRASALGRLFGALLFLICSINATTKADVTYAAVDDLGAENNLLRSASGWQGTTWSTAGGGLEWTLPTETVFGKCCWLPYFKGAPDLPYLSSSAFPSVFEGVLSDAVEGLSASYEWRTDNDNLEIKSPNERETEVVHKDGTDWQSYNLAETATLGEHKLTSTINGHFWTNLVVEETSLTVSAPKVLLLSSNAVKEGRDSGVVTIDLKLPEGESGTLSLECVSGAGKIQLSGETSWEVSGSTTKEVLISGKDYSNNKDDVRLIASFNSRKNESITSETSLSVLKVWHEAIAFVPEDNLRKCFGIAEKALVIWKPNNFGFTVSCDNGHIMAAVEGACTLEVAHDAGITMVALEKDDFKVTCPLQVLAPQDVMAIVCDEDLNGKEGDAGNIWVQFRVFVKPLTVSFKLLEIQEVPRIATDATGYFAQEKFSGALDHGKCGAGKWLPLTEINTYLDTAALGVLPPPWLNGGAFTRPIPCAWRYPRDENPTVNIFTQYEQRFELDADGTARIKKFGYYAERATNNDSNITNKVNEIKEGAQ